MAKAEKPKSKTAKPKRICIRGHYPCLMFEEKTGRPDLKSAQDRRGQKNSYSPLAPSAGDTVSSPFTAYGILDQGVTSNTVTLTSKTTGTTYTGTEVTPPPGANWAVEFNVLPDDYYLTDDEGGYATYIVDPIHVV